MHQYCSVYISIHISAVLCAILLASKVRLIWFKHLLFNMYSAIDDCCHLNSIDKGRVYVLNIQLCANIAFFA